MENPIKLVEYSDSPSKIDTITRMKAQSLLPPFQYQPLPLLPQMFTRVSKSV